MAVLYTLLTPKKLEEVRQMPGSLKSAFTCLLFPPPPPHKVTRKTSCCEATLNSNDIVALFWKLLLESTAYLFEESQ